MATTQLTPSALPGRPYGSFAGKEESDEPAGPHNPGECTRLSPYSVPSRLYGSFAGKEASDEPAPQPDPTPSVGSGGRGGVNPWPGRRKHSWDKWWKKEHQKRLQKKKDSVEKKVEELEVQLRGTRDDLQQARTLEAIQRLLKRLERLQALLKAEQARLDDLEMQEVAMIWAAWDE